MPTNPLQSMHEQAEASFLPYGPELQIVESYGEIEAEYAALRKSACLMDAPQRSVVVLTGKDRLTFINNVVTNEAKKLGPGTGVYAYMLNTKGRITLDLNILQSEDATLLEVDTRLTGALCKQLEKYHFSEDVKITDASEQIGRLTVLGPRAAILLGKVTDGGLDGLSEPLRHTTRQIAGVGVTIFRNDLTGEPGYELIVPRNALVKLWQVLHEAGNGHDGGEAANEGGLGLRAIGWSAFNTARIEAGTPLFEIDITENYLPMETGHWYARAVAVQKGCYTGQEVVARMHSHKAVARLFVGLRVEEGVEGGVEGGAGGKLPVAGTDIFDAERSGDGQAGAQVGIVTSSCLSPMLGLAPVAMGYVKKAFAEVGKAVEVLAGGGRVRARVVELPFWKPTEATAP